MTPRELLDRIETRVLLLDGGLGSLLIADGLAAGTPPERWVLERPERIAAAHRQYVDAGADVVHACTFGASAPKLAAVGLEGRAAEVNRAAVALAREAAGRRALVAGDIGPTGALFPPMGDATEDALGAAFREQASLLADAGVDLLSIETMYDLREACAAVAAAATTGLPVLASMTFSARKRGFFTLVGDRVGPSLRALLVSGAHVVGFNCTLTAPEMVPLIAEARAALDAEGTAPAHGAGPAPLVAQPNAGQPRPTPQGVVYDTTPAAFVADLERIVAAGARVVGGCCGTDPAFIRAARVSLDRFP